MKPKSKLILIDVGKLEGSSNFSNHSLAQFQICDDVSKNLLAGALS
jgi:hypothetical protein